MKCNVCGRFYPAYGKCKCEVSKVVIVSPKRDSKLKLSAHDFNTVVSLNTSLIFLIDGITKMEKALIYKSDPTTITRFNQLFKELYRAKDIILNTCEEFEGSLKDRDLNMLTRALDDLKEKCITTIKTSGGY